MKLSVSNIAWEQNELNKHLKLLKQLKCDGVEIAPSCVWKEPVCAGKEEIENFKRIVSKHGLIVFGSPASRKVGNKAYGTCYQVAVEVLKKLGKEAALNDTFFCIEPLGPTDGDFIQTADEAYQLVQDVGESKEIVKSAIKYVRKKYFVYGVK